MLFFHFGIDILGNIYDSFIKGVFYYLKAYVKGINMALNDKIEEYLEILECSGRDLSSASGLSDSAISRYRNGSREPAYDSQEFNALVSGFEKLFKKNGKKPAEDIREALKRSLPTAGLNREKYAERLGILTDISEISRTKIAATAGYDPSFITRVIRGERTPSDYVGFTDKISKCIASGCNTLKSINLLSDAIGIDTNLLDTPETRASYIYDYLLSSEGNTPELNLDSARQNKESISNFLSKLDEFDLNDYMKKIHFDKIKVLTSPVMPSGSKHYSGASGMKKAEIAFLKRTVLSPSKEDIWEYSDLPFEELASDKKFSRSWMIGLAMMLKKGLRLHIIHDLGRPFPEMILGLESWIPLYMTGLISPYYLKHEPESSFSHLIRLSGSTALIGECSEKDLSTALFYLSSDPAEIKAAVKRKEALFSHALPLMEIFHDNRKDEYEKLVKKETDALLEEKGEVPVTLSATSNIYFKNIEITRYGHKLIIIAKQGDPEINFVIRYPKLVDAIISMFDVGEPV